MNIKRFSFMKAPIALFLAVVMASFPSVSYASIGGARGNANVLFRALRANGWNVRDCFDVGPAWSGTYFIKVTMYNSTYNGAH